MAREFPKTMFHKSLPPVVVHTPDEEKKLGPGWYTRYIHQEYPRVMYGPGENQLIVNSAAERADAEAQGFQLVPFPVEHKLEPAPRQIRSGTIDAQAVEAIQELQYQVDCLKTDIAELQEKSQILISAVKELQTVDDKLAVASAEAGNSVLPPRNPGESKQAYAKRVEDFLAAAK